MSIRAQSTAVGSAPIRISPAIVSAFVALIATLLAVRPDMMMPLLRSVMPGL